MHGCLTLPALLIFMLLPTKQHDYATSDYVELCFLLLQSSRLWYSHLGLPLWNIGGSWDLIIKVAGARKTRPRRTAFAYEATYQGRIMFSSCASSGASTTTAATQDALVEAVVKSENLGFSRILIMCHSKRLVNVCNMQCSPNWQEKTMLSDLLNLQQQGLCCKTLFVPRVILGTVCNTAKFALKVPGRCCWVHPAIV
ncbi:hypothetical protein SO802_003158 [Lithocarpus litseifolius]|uniref:RNase H type-1 domain-containing protein n=1 Tax=Lithocarpus litseifolius TaxID=425828 RepID=A0AAW2E340_9ROSI